MDLTVTLLQPDIHWEDAAANHALYDSMLKTVPVESRLVLLPEMFTTGFTMHAKEVAETMDGETMQWMASRASELDAIVCGSLVIRELDHYYNRLIWMRPDGSYESYDKRHLFSMAGEDKVYTPGQKRLVLDLDGWSVFPQVCYDLRFPVWARNTIDYDLYINVANWPERRSYPWRSLLVARAIENQAYVVGINRVGKDENGIYYHGGSCFIDPVGEVLDYYEHESGVYTKTLSKKHLTETRQRFPFLQDRDRFTIMDTEDE